MPGRTLRAVNTIMSHHCRGPCRSDCYRAKAALAIILAAEAEWGCHETTSVLKAILHGRVTREVLYQIAKAIASSGSGTAEDHLVDAERYVNAAGRLLEAAIEEVREAARRGCLPYFYASI